MIVIKSKDAPATVTKAQLKAMSHVLTSLGNRVLWLSDAVVCDDDMTKLRYRLNGRWKEIPMVLRS